MKALATIFTVGVILNQCVNCRNVAHDQNLRNATYTDNSYQQLHESTIIGSDEVTFYRWFPWKRPQLFIKRVDENGEKCEELSSINQFPDDLFTQEQRLAGAVIFHFIGAAYFFTVLGLIINHYFIPAVQCICERLKITPDVGAAVFMAVATAIPELFTNLISTFIADSDMGLGAVLGSLMWNTLGVASVSSLATSKPVKMDWTPIARDGIVFFINVIVLIIVSWDGYMHWYEALILVSFSIPYFAIMFQSPRISRFLKKKFEDEYGCCNSQRHDSKKIEKEKQREIYIAAMERVDPKGVTEYEKAFKLLKQQRMGLYPCPKDSLGRTVFWYYSWPARLVLRTMPNPKASPKLYILTFLLCIVWIGVVTYLIFFMLILICHTFSIPESVMGITVFAIGGCTPELITGIIMARKDQAGTGLANSFGTSSLGIILCLGAPWLVSSLMKLSSEPATVVHLGTSGIRYTIVSLLFIPILLLSIFAAFKFHLRKLSGMCLAITYLSLVTWAIVIELQILFPSGQC